MRKRLEERGEGWGQGGGQVAISTEGNGMVVWGQAVAEEVWGVWGIEGQG